MPPSPIYTETLTVPALECDFQNHWKPVSILQAMQRAANIHAARLGAGFETLAAHHQTWVFSRFKIRFSSFPTADQLVTIRTFVKGVTQKLFFRRDFHILAAGWRPATPPPPPPGCCWIPASWRLLPPAALKATLPDPPDLVGLDKSLEKLAVPEGPDPHISSPPATTPLTCSGTSTTPATSSGSPIASPSSITAPIKLAWLQINYNHEVRPGEQVALRSVQNPANPATWWVYGTNLATGKRAFEAETGWEAYSPRPIACCRCFAGTAAT